MANRESLADRRRRAGKILTILKKLYPDADCALHRTTPLELLVATILSAQCTDERVNLVTAELFRKYRTAADYAAADPAAFEREIRSTGFFRQKAKSILGSCKMLADRFGGQVPQTMEELTTLPGVARKTANVMLGTMFGRNEGVVVDTHVGRLAHDRLKLTWRSRGPKDAVRIEQDLMKLFPRSDWTWLSHALICHGRQVCRARKPDCAGCALSKDCPTAFAWGG